MRGLMELYGLSAADPECAARLPSGVLLDGGSLSHHPAPMLFIEPESGGIVEANRAACAFYGHPFERLCTMFIDDINMLQRDEILARRRAAATGLANRFSMPHRLATGEVREMLVHSHPVMVGERQLLFSVVHDVTECSRMGEALRSREERLELVASSATLGLWDWDVRTGRLSVNPGWVALLGFPAGWTQRGIDDWMERIHHADRNRVLTALNAHLEGRTDRYEAEYRIHDGGDALRWVHDQGRVVRRDAVGVPARVIGLFMDVTARRYAEESRARLFELSLDMLCILDFEGRFHEVNPAWNSTLGWTVSEMLETSLGGLTHEADATAVAQALDQLAAGERVRGLEVRLRCSDGTWRWLSWRARPEVEQRRIYAVVRDVTHQKRQEVELRRMASMDALTGVSNRATFMETLADMMQRCCHDRAVASVLVMDVDNFKLVNDTWGHAVGDEVLRRLGRAMVPLLRTVDTVGRLGGEEFGVLLPGVGPEAACCVAERLRAAIAAMEVPCDDGRGEALRVTVSVGVASCPPYHSVTEVLRAADKALYRAKASGRDRVVCGPVALLEMSCPESPTIP